MGKRIIIMFSMLMASLAILLSSDLVSTQMIYSELDTMSTTVGYYISKEAGISESVKEYVKKEAHADIYCGMEICTALKKGDTYIYVIERKITPILLHRGEDAVRIRRSVVIGLYS